MAKIDEMVEDDMFFGFKRYEGKYDDPEFVNSRKDYFENFLIPQAKEKGEVVWSDGTTARCDVRTAERLYCEWR